MNTRWQQKPIPTHSIIHDTGEVCDPLPRLNHVVHGASFFWFINPTGNESTISGQNLKGFLALKLVKISRH